MAKKFLRIRDDVTLVPLEVVKDTKINDNFGNAQSGSITVRVAATHSGIVTKNNTFYLPDKMKTGAATWTSQYPKPVLVHHRDDQDAIGRVIAAEYVDLSESMHATVRNSIFKDKQKSKDLFDKFNNGKMSYGQQIDYVKDNFANSGLLDDENYEGLGYLKLTAVISDPDAIQKVKDGRYLTGSVSASTDKAMCSICKQDWIEEGRCEHSPGDMYDGAKAFIIAGNFEYEEWSFVNKPADRHSKTLEIVNSDNNKDTSMKDALSIKTHADRVMLVQMHDALHYKYDYDVIAAKRGQEEGSAHYLPPPQDVYDLHQKLHREAKDAGLNTTLQLGALDDTLPEELKPPMPAYAMSPDSTKEKSNSMSTQVKDNTELTNSEPVEEATEQENGAVSAPVDEGVTMDAATTETPAIKSVQDMSTDELEAQFNALDLGAESLTDEQSELIYELMMRDSDNADEVKVQDAKLSTEKRKSLPSSTFCGPGRSFPVPDCAHVTAARRLVGRYKGPGSKTSILACVARKAKALGCDSGNSDSVEEETKLADTNAVDTIVSECAECKTLVEQAQAATKDAVASVELKDNEIQHLKDQLIALREEFKHLFADVIALEDQLVKAKQEVREVKAERVADFERLSGSGSERKQLVDTMLKDLDDNSLNSKFESVDMDKIVDKLNSGLSREPKGTVESAATITDSRSDNQTDSAPDSKTEQLVMDTYNYLVEKKGAAAAERYLAKQKAQGNIK